MSKYIVKYIATKYRAIEAPNYQEAKWEAQRLLDYSQVSFEDSDSLEVADIQIL